MWYKKNQDEILNNEFTCTRLITDPNNKSLIRGFNSERNPNLAWYLKRDAWNDDGRNYRSCFLVKEKNKIVLYFSLQCGLLFKCHEKQLQGIIHKESAGETRYYIKDDILDVTQVVPGVELGHFCINDSYRKRKKEWKVQHGIAVYTVGAYVFYKFIAPKVKAIAEVAGSQFLYLFCADDGTNRLLDYYVNTLNFSIMDNMACVRSTFDRGLTCLTIKMERLKDDLALFNDMEKAEKIMDYLHCNNSINIYQARREFNVEAPYLLFNYLVEHEFASVVTITTDGKIVKIKKQDRQ